MPQLLTKLLVEKLARAGERKEVADSRAPGLVLRANVRTSHFEFVWSPAGKKRRITLGTTAELSVDEARKLAHKASDAVKQGYLLDEAWVRDQRADPTERKLDVSDGLWTFVEAREAYFKGNETRLKESTQEDYRGYLSYPELKSLERRPVAQITDDDLTAVVVKIHASGREGSADSMKKKLSAMWGWLARGAQRPRSGVRTRPMIDVPDRTAGSEKEAFYPYPSEVADLLNRARAGELGVASLVTVLVCLTGQRRTVCAQAQRRHIEDGVWSIPPASRKTANKRKDRTFHTVPWPEEVRIPRSGRWVFPAARVRRASEGKELANVHGSTVTHRFKNGDAGLTPHEIRRSITTTLKGIGYHASQIRMILDHNEGRTSTMDIHYDGSEEIPIKRKMLQDWKDVLEGKREFDEKAVFRKVRGPGSSRKKNVKPKVRSFAEAAE